MKTRPRNKGKSKKRQRAIDRHWTTGLFLLRATQLGISIADLELLSVGNVLDMMIERANDEYEYPMVASADDIARL